MTTYATNTTDKIYKISQSARKRVSIGMLHGLQTKNVVSLRFKVWVLLVWQTLSGRVFQALGAAILKARSPNSSLDRGKNWSIFDADLRNVGPVESAETGCIKLDDTDDQKIRFL